MVVLEKLKPKQENQEASKSEKDSSFFNPERTIPAIEFRNVHLAFDEKVVLDGVSFKVGCGETKIILGQSGSGKSTIVRLVLGLLQPDSGEILIDGDDITYLSEPQMMTVRKKLGMVFQEGALFDSLPVYDNVGYRLHEQGVDENIVEEKVKEALSFVDLEDVVEMMPSELSGGMRRRVGIARALIGDPQIVLFDEPTAGLDPPTARTICELVIKLRDIQDVSSIFVTHDMRNLEYLSKEYALLDENGEIVFENEGERMCLINTGIIMIKEGKIIFSGKEEELRLKNDPYIQRFLNGK